MGLATHLLPEKMTTFIRIAHACTKPGGHLVFNAPTDANGYPLTRSAGSQNHSHNSIVATMAALGMAANWTDHGLSGESRRVYWAAPPGLPTPALKREAAS